MSDYPMLISNKLHSFRNFMVQIYKKYFSFGIHFRKENHTLKTLSNTKTEITLIALNKDADNEADHTDSF